ncbi:hypothetical protein Tco_1032976, partial [Tanacetum coccineum]
ELGKQSSSSEANESSSDVIITKESEGSLLSSDDLDVDIIPSASVLRQLAIGVEYMLNFQYAFPQISVVILVFGY